MTAIKKDGVYYRVDGAAIDELVSEADLIDVGEVWACSECDELYEDKNEAELCCVDEDEDEE
jgi:hypothetical protein